MTCKNIVCEMGNKDYFTKFHGFVFPLGT